MIFNRLKYIIIAILFLFSITGVYSAEVVDEVSYDNLTSESLILKWEDVEWAIAYSIDYWTESWTWKTSKTDLIDIPEYIFEGLEENTTYYFSVIWFDDLANEIYSSYEIAINTLPKDSESEEEVTWLYLEDSYMTWKNQIELIFSNELDNEPLTEREFKIESINNFNDYFEVLSTSLSEQDSKTLILELDWEPTIWVEYKVVVLSIKDIYNQNIENWVDSDATFLWVEIEEEVELNSAIDKEPIKIDEPVEVYEPVEVEIKEENQNAWKDINEDEVNSNIIKVSQDNSKLPITWPEHFLLIALAFIFSALVFVFKFKKS